MKKSISKCLKVWIHAGFSAFLLIAKGGEAMAKVGPKGKSEKWRTKEGLSILKGWALEGRTDAEIIREMGIATSTFYDWKLKYPEISEALKWGGEYSNSIAVQSLFKMVIGGSFPAIKYWLSTRGGDRWRENRKDTLDIGEQLARIDKYKAEVAKIEAENKERAGGEQPGDDGFLEALNGSTEGDWDDEN